MPRPSPSGRLADPGALLATTHDVGDGVRVRLRLTRPSDRTRVRAFLEGLSPETHARRFLSAMDVVPEPIVRRFTYFDPRERLVLAATAPLHGSEAVVGIADVDMLATGLAELGLVVDDAVQGRGVGRLLAEAAGSLAARQGAARLKAEIYTENEPMLRLMEALGPSVRTLEDDRTVVYVRLPAARRRAA